MYKLATIGALVFALAGPASAASHRAPVRPSGVQAFCPQGVRTRKQTPVAPSRQTRCPPPLKAPDGVGPVALRPGPARPARR